MLIIQEYIDDQVKPAPLHITRNIYTHTQHTKNAAQKKKNKLSGDARLKYTVRQIHVS